MSRIRLAGFGSALVLSALIGGTIIGSVAADTLPATGSAAPAAAGALAQAGNAAAPGGAVDAATGATAGAYCKAFLTAFAAALGVDESTLAPAASKAAASTIAAAVAAGDLTQARADRLTTRLKDAQVGGCPGFANRIGQPRPAAGAVRDGVEAVAKALGLTPAELRTQLKDGKSLKDIAAAKGVPYATVTAAAIAPIKAKLDAAVAAGTIKQARADRILARLTQNLADGRLRKAPPASPATPGG